MTVRWLQYSKLDLANGLGGVEVHARSLDRELKALGVDSKISADARDLADPSWTVIHTHGSAPLTPKEWRALRARKTPAQWVHTLHGTTLGRMAACGEWTWPGGYFASARELWGVSQADVILAVHEDLWLNRFARSIGKKIAVCSNGYDSALEAVELPPGSEAIFKMVGDFFVFVGRGSDPVKGAALLKKVLKTAPEIRVVAAPGEGFGDEAVHSGLLTPAQVRTLMLRSKGLIVPSYYEGLPLVVLEALSLGVPVVAADVGGIRGLSRELKGLIRCPAGDVAAFARAMRWSPQSGEAMGLRNRSHLSTWRQVAERALEAVK